MDILKIIRSLLSKKQPTSAPLIIIKKDSDDVNIRKYESIDEAIADLENDPNVPSEKIEKLKASLKQLKNKTSIKIRNGEILL